MSSTTSDQVEQEAQVYRCPLTFGNAQICWLLNVLQTSPYTCLRARAREHARGLIANSCDMKRPQEVAGNSGNEDCCSFRRTSHKLGFKKLLRFEELDFDRQTDRQTNRQTDRQTDGSISGMRKWIQPQMLH